MKHLFTTLLSILIIGSISVYAADKTFDGDAGDGLWSTPSNWDGGTLPASGDNILIQSLGGASNLEPEADRTVGTIEAAGADGFWIDHYGGDDYQLTIQGNKIIGSYSFGGPVVLENDVYLSTASGDLRFNRPVSEDATPRTLTVDMSSSGDAVRMDAANTYSGGTILSNGQVEIVNDGAFGTGTIYVRGGQFYCNRVPGHTIGNPIQFDSAYFYKLSSGDLTFTGILSGTCTQLRADGGIVTIGGEGDNTCTITKWVVNGATFQIDKTDAVQSDAPVNFEFPTWTGSDGYLLLNDGVTWDNRVYFYGGGINGVGSMHTSGTSYWVRPLWIGNSTGSAMPASVVLQTAAGGVTIFNTNFRNDSNTPEGGIHKTGGGTAVFNGPNEHVSGTWIEEGTIVCNHSGALSDCPCGIDTGATLAGVVTAQAVITNAGTIAPGTSVGTISGTDLVMEEGAVYACEFDGATADLISLSGTLTLPALANSVTVDVSVLSGGSGSQTIFQYSTLSGSTNSLFVDLSGTPFSNYAMTEDGSSISLQLVPEPGMLIGILGGLLVLLRRK